MTKLYLITGFLGSGKTSFLREFVGRFKEQSLRIIINEFGKVGVDGELMKPSGIELDEITGGSIFCSCRSDQFEKALNAALDSKPDCIIVEASGLSDPTGIRKLLSDGGYDDRIEYGGCVCLADAVNLPKVYQTARVCKKQLSVCDAVLLNKIDMASPEQLSVSHEIIRNQRPDISVTETMFGHIPDTWDLTPIDTRSADGIHRADINLHSLKIKISDTMSLHELTKFLEAFAEDTYRIKGFVNLRDVTYLADCVGNLVQVKPCKEPVGTDNSLTVLYGYGLRAKRSVMKAAEWYPERILEIEG